jgi:hypothetical protein
MCLYYGVLETVKRWVFKAHKQYKRDVVGSLRTVSGMKRVHAVCVVVALLVISALVMQARDKRPEVASQSLSYTAKKYRSSENTEKPTRLPDGGGVSLSDSTGYIPPIEVVSPQVVENPGEGPCLQEERGGVSFYAGRERAARRETIGYSVEGRPIVAEHWGSDEGAQVLVVAQIHGDECGGGLLASFIRRDPPETWGLWLIASMNPDGNVAGTRRNASNVDLNRDGYNQRAPETRAFLDFVQKIKPAYTIHVHSPLNWVGPWGDKGAKELAAAVSRQSGVPLNGWAGDGLGYLWEGAEAVEPGSNAVLVEFPAMSPKEAVGSLSKGRGDVASRLRVGAMAEGVLLGLKEYLGS